MNDDGGIQWFQQVGQFERMDKHYATASKDACLNWKEYVKGTPGRKSETSLSGLAKKYGVGYQAISKIINGDIRK